MLINNVRDRERAALLAEGALERGEIDRYAFVDQWADQGFRATGLKPADFGRFLHWSDCAVAALALAGPDLLCYTDVDTRLIQPVDWISPALMIMEDDHRVGVANPAWVMPDGTVPVHAEADECGDDHILGYGFSDMVFLVRRSQLLRPMLRRGIPLWIDCPATLRFPAAPLGVVFEQVVEAYMRRKHLMRLTMLNAAFTPIAISSYLPSTLIERFRAKRNAALTGVLVRVRRRLPGLVTSPRLRFTGLLDPDFGI